MRRGATPKAQHNGGGRLYGQVHSEAFRPGVHGGSLAVWASNDRRHPATWTENEITQKRPFPGSCHLGSIPNFCRNEASFLATPAPRQRVVLTYRSRSCACTTPVLPQLPSPPCPKTAPAATARAWSSSATPRRPPAGTSSLSCFSKATRCSCRRSASSGHGR